MLAVVVLLAWSNGSNDNFKGVSTLYGSESKLDRSAPTISLKEFATT